MVRQDMRLFRKNHRQPVSGMEKIHHPDMGAVAVNVLWFLFQPGNKPA